MQEMTACRILERVCTHRKLVLINNYSSVCFLYLWLSLLTQHCLHFPADTRHWFQLLSVPLFIEFPISFLRNVSSAFILSAFFPSPSGFLPSLPLWLGCLWIKALRVAWRQTGFLIGVPVQKCQETWSTSAVPALFSCCVHPELPPEQNAFHLHTYLVHVYAVVKLSGTSCFLLFIRHSKWWNLKKKSSVNLWACRHRSTLAFFWNLNLVIGNSQPSSELWDACWVRGMSSVFQSLSTVPSIPQETEFMPQNSVIYL